MGDNAWLSRAVVYEERDEDNVRHEAGAWRTRARCSELPTAIMYDAAYQQTAVSLCKKCPVSGECLAYALKYREAFGIWGGLTAPERTKLARELAGGRRKPGPRPRVRPWAGRLRRRTRDLGAL